MGSNSKTVEPYSRKGKLLLIALVCIVLVFGFTTLIQSLILGGPPLGESTISNIISAPVYWENRNVIVRGIAENIPVGIIQPFNYWLFDEGNRTLRIGLRWYSDNNLTGSILTVVGVVKKGYAWVNPAYPGWWTYYIDATSISKE
jgi:hypothetical protein